MKLPYFRSSVLEGGRQRKKECIWLAWEGISLLVAFFFFSPGDLTQGCSTTELNPQPFLHFILRQYLSWLLRLALYLWFSCLSLLSLGLEACMGPGFLPILNLYFLEWSYLLRKLTWRFPPSQWTVPLQCMMIPPIFPAHSETWNSGVGHSDTRIAEVKGEERRRGEGQLVKDSNRRKAGVEIQQSLWNG